MALLALHKLGSTGSAVSLGLGSGVAVGVGVSSTAEAGEESATTRAVTAIALVKENLNEDITLKNKA